MHPRLRAYALESGPEGTPRCHHRCVVPSEMDLVRAGQNAVRAGDWSTALDCFEQAGEASSGPDALEGTAEALYLKADFTAAASTYERAFAARRRAGDADGAGRCARMLSWIHGSVLGDWAVGEGWLGRAIDVLSQSSSSTASGWVELIRAGGEPDVEARQARLRRALDIGRQSGAADMEFEALGWLGLTDVFAGRIQSGLALLDQSLTAVCAGEVEELYVIEGNCCGMLWACELATDVARAEQWMRAVHQLRERRGLVTMAAFCLAHQGAILTSAGRWTEAEAVLVRAHRMFPARSTRMNRRAVALLAELRLRQGRLEEAGELLADLDRDLDALRPLARLHLARGKLVLARDFLERALAAPLEGTNDAPLLGLLVELALREGHLDEAGRAADRLADVASSGGEAMAAMAALARGRVAAATDEPETRALLDAAIDGFTRTGMPLEAAIARLEVARVLSVDRPEVAVAEAKIALAEFERLPAPPFADAAGALLRTLGAPIRTGPKGFGALTRREAEVLALIGEGLSNNEIGARLVIASKTVEHHVGHVLAKLGLRNRSEAAAYAMREKLVPK